MQSFDKTLSKASFNRLMWREDGTMSFIDSRTKFILTGKKLITKYSRLRRPNKKSAKNKKLWKFFNFKKENIGKNYGKLKEASNKC